MGNYFYRKKFQCCNGHKLTKFKVWHGSGYNGQPFSSCNQCSQLKHAMLICETCNYKICWQCNPVKHEEICRKINWQIYKGLGYAQTYCQYCQKSSKSLLTCKTCDINICFECGKFKHSTLCENNQFFFPEKKNTYQRSFCNFCSKQQMELMMCNKCQMKVCNNCRKTKNWK